MTSPRFIPAFNEDESVPLPGSLQFSTREAFFRLVNAAEHPEILPLAYDLVAHRTRTVAAEDGLAARLSRFVGQSAESFPELLDGLTEERSRYAQPTDLTRSQTRYCFTQFMPTALIDGCWLQSGVRVPHSRTSVGAALTRLYAHQIGVSPGRPFVRAYRELSLLVGAPSDDVASRAFPERVAFHAASFALPVLLLSLGQFAGSFAGEIMGANLAWHFLDLTAFGPDRIHDVCTAHGIPVPAAAGVAVSDRELGRRLAREAALQFLEQVGARDRGHAWSRLLGGVLAAAAAWDDWFTGMKAAAPPGAGRSVGADGLVSGRSWDAVAFRDRSERLFGACGVRELFHYLVNVDRYPDVLPIAERRARAELDRSMARIRSGDPPIPSPSYDGAALERWFRQRQREQIDAYRPPGRRTTPKEAFIDVTVQLAPILLIDGGWLQGIATPGLIHTAVGATLFPTLLEEVGAGHPEANHAVIYRALLAAMGEQPPPVESREFASWTRLKDVSFDAATLWLSMSCFPQRFLPELLGLNLALELAGIGGPLAEARDALQRFGFPTRFVDMHRAADDDTPSRALEAIKYYMDAITGGAAGAERAERAWRQVWSGVGVARPEMGRLRLFLQRITRRTVPLIFPR